MMMTIVMTVIFYSKMATHGTKRGDYDGDDDDDDAYAMLVQGDEP